ncbi:MAG: hypothetical protein JWO86_3163, partial [Myxococcaceae bacterium]|nr:hypothetical protein [Myxococcaceae bacterium]
MDTPLRLRLPRCGRRVALATRATRVALGALALAFAGMTARDASAQSTPPSGGNGNGSDVAPPGPPSTVEKPIVMWPTLTPAGDEPAQPT